MSPLSRRSLLVASAAFAAIANSACSKSNSGPAISGDEVTMGQANAPLTLTEYYSLMCPVCAEFHKDVWVRLKANFIDTGKVKMVFREVPTHNGPVATAEFQVARCGGATAEQYATRVASMFEQRDAIEALGSMDAIQQRLIEIGGASGLSEQQVLTCINDPAGAERLTRNTDAASAKYGQGWGTPLLELNGERLIEGADYTYAGLARRLDAAWAAAHH